MTLRIGFDPTQYACAHDMSNRLIGYVYTVVALLGLNLLAVAHRSLVAQHSVIVGPVQLLGWPYRPT